MLIHAYAPRILVEPITYPDHIIVLLCERPGVEATVLRNGQSLTPHRTTPIEPEGASIHEYVLTAQGAGFTSPRTLGVDSGEMSFLLRGATIEGTYSPVEHTLVGNWQFRHLEIEGCRIRAPWLSGSPTLLPQEGLARAFGVRPRTAEASKLRARRLENFDLQDVSQPGGSFYSWVDRPEKLGRSKGALIQTNSSEEGSFSTRAL